MHLQAWICMHAAELKPVPVACNVQVQHFAAPGDAEYEPAPPSNRPPSPRLVRNRELPLQARIDTETVEEKRIRITQWKKEEVGEPCTDCCQVALHAPSVHSAIVTTAQQAQC